MYFRWVIWLLTLGQRHHPAALWTTKQPFSGTLLRLFDPHGEGPRKIGLNPACLIQPSWLTAANRTSPLYAVRNIEVKTSMKHACWNVRTMMDSDTNKRPQRWSALVARELSRFDIDVAALSEVRFADQGSLTENGAG